MEENEVRSLLIQYRNIVNKLKEAGIIRSSKVVADYGEYIASRKLNLSLVESSIQKDYDAFDKDNKKYQIKTRKATAWNKPGIFPIKQTSLEDIDYVIYVELDDNWNLIKLLKIPKEEIKPNKHNRVVLNKNLVERFGVL